MRPAFLFFVLSAFLGGAEYGGQNVDGTKYFAFARSLQTGKYYPATVEFNRDRAIVRFKSGQRLQLTLDQTDVDDPEEVIASDPVGGLWALSIDGLEEPRHHSKASFAESESS